MTYTQTLAALLATIVLAMRLARATYLPRIVSGADLSLSLAAGMCGLFRRLSATVWL